VAPGTYHPGAPYPGVPYPGVQYNVQYNVVSPKSGGLAVLLTFLWLGAGHLYLGRTTPGVLLLVLHFFLVLIFIIPFVGWVVGFLGWLAAFIGASVSCSSIAAEENARMQHWARGW
jgi:TM2 domain-containing membrane protein YozV